jgi:cytochrome o ubiquinol oxidase subunit 2
LYLIADEPGKYTGRAVEINGEGYADMTFSVRSSSQEDFEKWIEQVKKSVHHLNGDLYQQLVKHSVNQSIILFSEVEQGLYQQVIHKYMYPAAPVL